MLKAVVLGVTGEENQDAPYQFWWHRVGEAESVATESHAAGTSGSGSVGPRALA
jgi:hypothetical protein